ncbi:hypothetical protein ACOTJC_29085 [Achromobacter xylosoxidans]|uniref:hypothetical protein n=1 Tax=Alcaligenes xylosoxydans xylosoxydans TaxID=85698 RepID=UPI002E1903EC|nr:hypothetical protein [Achromobacter xylosoxidans]
MNDQQLLALAAKAADDGIVFYGECWRAQSGREWNPLLDDGDALRLAVKLEMQVCIGIQRIDATLVGYEDGQVFRGTEAKDGDICTATRQAIVRAAAAIGKEM